MTAWGFVCRLKIRRIGGRGSVVDGLFFFLSFTLIITQLCRVPVCASVSGRGHLVFLHGAQPGTGRAHNDTTVVFKSADA